MFIFFHLISIIGSNIQPAKKKRIKPKVKGGILVRASLNIGAAAPQIIFVIIRAITGFMYNFFIFYDFDFLLRYTIKSPKKPVIIT